MSLEELVNMNLDEDMEPTVNNMTTTLNDFKHKSSKKKNIASKKMVPIQSDSDSDSDSDVSFKTPKKNKKKNKGKKISGYFKEPLIIIILFMVLSSKLASGQADKLLRIQTQDYSIYDLMIRAIAMSLLFFIFCRLLKN